jgi:hypothetical protein
MALSTMRAPIADDEHIPHEIEDHDARDALAAASVASAKADSSPARCIVRSDCFVVASIGIDSTVSFDLDTYISEANTSTGLAVEPFDVEAVTTKGKRQNPTPVTLKRALMRKARYRNKLTQWCKADKPNYPWMASLAAPDAEPDAASTLLPSGRHANIGAFVSRTESETKGMKAEVASQSTQLVATQTAVQDLENMLKSVAREAIVTVTVGTGDAAETPTSPTEVAREYSEWSDRRMGLMHAKWFQRLDVAEGHAVWAVGGGRRER